MDTRPPPQAAPRGGFGFNRVYRTNLRPLIISIAVLSALWTLFSGIGFFRSISIDNREGVPKLALFAIVLGSINMAIFVIESFGVVAATSQRLALVRLYAYLSLVGVLLTFGSGLLEVIVHFTSKDDILKECTNLTNGSTFAVYPFGFFGPTRHETVSPEEAASWCRRAYDDSSWQDIISLLITTFLMVFISALTWGYYRQVLDPTSIVNFSRAPARYDVNYPTHYNPPYNASVPNLGYNAPYGGPQPVYAPPAGPPPPRVPGESKPGPGADGYTVDDKENPFADFDERTERDVTSRPGPGGRETFNN